MHRVPSEFDEYARNYLQQLDHPLRRIVTSTNGNYFIDLKCTILYELMESAHLRPSDLAVADIGSGIGLFEERFGGEFASLAALDLSHESLKVSSHLHPAGNCEGYVCSDALRLPLASASLDIVFCSCLFHHMDHSCLDDALQEMHRVCKVGGYVVVFEHNPFNPLTQLVVRTTPLDKNARLLRPRQVISAFLSARSNIIAKDFILFGPRPLDTWLRRFKGLLNRVPFGGQYVIIGQKQR